MTDRLSQRRRYVPLSVRYGGPREKARWWAKGICEWIALKLAPWLGGALSMAYENDRLRDVGGRLASSSSDLSGWTIRLAESGLIVVSDDALAAAYEARNAAGAWREIDG